MSNIKIRLFSAAAAAALALAPGIPGAGFTRAAHTTRRRIDPVQRLPARDAEVAAWNAAVDRKKAEKRRARGRS